MTAMRGRGITWPRWLPGDDPALALADFLGDYWNRQNQKLLISSLKGMFAAASMAGNLLAIHWRASPARPAQRG